MPFSIYLQGFTLSFGLIVAIGAQNAFVLRQGLRREHIVSIVIFCALADAILMTAGVLGMAKVIGDSVLLTRLLALAGSLFLFVYGWRAFQRTKTTARLDAHKEGASLDYSAAMLQVAAFTLLNPHVYLDTLVLVGSMGSQHPYPMNWWFISGAISASATWFCLLGFGAFWLAPVFAKPKAWQILDLVIGIIMWVLSISLIAYLFETF